MYFYDKVHCVFSVSSKWLLPETLLTFSTDGSADLVLSDDRGHNAFGEYLTLIQMI